MLEALRSLRLEIDALSSALRASPRTFVADPKILERVQELFLLWSTQAYPMLVASGIPRELLSRFEGFAGELVRFTGKNTRKQSYLKVLSSLRRALTEQLLLEVARITPVGGTLATPPRPTSLIPEIADLPNELVPNALYGSVAIMQRFLREYSFDRNVFIMVAYRQRLNNLIRRVSAALQELELNAIVARDHRLTDDLYNPIACLLCCNFGIAIFDRGDEPQTHNPNIVYELAIMQMLKRPCLILKHRSVRVMPSDFLHRLYEDYRTVNDAVQRVESWWFLISRGSRSN